MRQLKAALSARSGANLHRLSQLTLIAQLSFATSAFCQPSCCVCRAQNFRSDEVQVHSHDRQPQIEICFVRNSAAFNSIRAYFKAITCQLGLEGFRQPDFHLDLFSSQICLIRWLFLILTFCLNFSYCSIDFQHRIVYWSPTGRPYHRYRWAWDLLNRLSPRHCHSLQCFPSHSPD